MKKAFLFLLLSLLPSLALGQQSINCTVTATKALVVTALNCDHPPINQFSASFGASVSTLTVSINQPSQILVLGGTESYTATVTNAVNTSVTWSATGGTINSSTGVYTANTAGVFTITATSVQDPTVSGSTPVTINAVPPISGADNSYCGPGNSPAFGTDPGPATLPQACTNTAESSTPAPGATTTVGSGNLQTAINNAACGDTLNLQVGFTYTGVFTLPNKNCDSAHWVRIQSASGAVPPEGARETPCYSGVASLPNRPEFSNCPSTTVVTAKIVASGANAFKTADGAAYYRIGPGLEITNASGLPAGQPDALVSISGTSTLPSNIIVDRVWIHGLSGVFAKRGVKLDGINLAVIDSTITDVHAVGADNYGVQIGKGTGPFKLTDLFVEGGSASIFFGGQVTTGAPANVEIRKNHLFIPLTEMVGNPLWDGKVWSVGTRLQLINASQVLIEGNILNYAWGNQNGLASQGGDGSIAWLGSKNLGSSCFGCSAGQIVARYNIISHAGGGFYLFDTLSATGATATQATAYSVHDNQLDDISTAWSRNGNANGTVHRLFGTVIFPPPSSVSIFHNTGIALSGTGFLSLGNNNPTGPYRGFLFNDNIVYQLGFGIYGCSGTFGTTALNNCVISPTFTNNLVVGTSRISLPPGNFNVASSSQVGYANFNGGNGGNYTLCTAPNVPAGCTARSSYAASATDGTAIGADVGAITQATANVN